MESREARQSRDPKDIERDYEAFGLTLGEARARLGRARTHTAQQLYKLGARWDRQGKLVQPHTSHYTFARENAEFRAACEAAGLPATARQASKFRRGFGAAYAAWQKREAA